MLVVCPRRQRWQWAWLQRQQASSNFRLTASLKRPFTSAANATRKRSVSERKHRQRYRTFALRNALLDFIEARMMDVVVSTEAIRNSKLQSSSPPNQHPGCWMPFLLPNQQCQNTEGKILLINCKTIIENSKIAMYAHKYDTRYG